MVADATDFDERDINRNFDYDYEAYAEVKRNLSRLIDLGELRLALELSLELMKQGSYQVEMSDEGLMAVRKAVVGDLAGFVVQAKIPWGYFRDHQPKVGEKLLFNLAINFSNQSGTANMGKAYWNGPSHMVQDVGSEAQIHPEHWGWLVLGGP